MQEVQHKLSKCLEKHPTKECKKYNKDGTTKRFEFGNSRDSRAHSGKKSAFITYKKEAKSTKLKIKKMKRQQKDAKKHCKRSNNKYSGSSSSGSSINSDSA